MVKKRAISAASFLMLFGFSVHPAVALTASDVMDKMNSDERTGFIAGAGDMASHMFAVHGDPDKAQCAVDWLFNGEDPWPAIDAFFGAHRDKDAVAVLHVLINRKCGK